MKNRRGAQTSTAEKDKTLSSKQKDPKHPANPRRFCEWNQELKQPITVEEMCCCHIVKNPKECLMYGNIWSDQVCWSYKLELGQK